MKRYILIIFIPLFLNAQSSYDNNGKFLHEDKRSVGCVDLDEALIDLISIFGTPSFLESLLGCSEIIPALEMGFISSILPFDIPLDCNTDLTPFGYFDMNVSDICECSCQNFLDIDFLKPNNKTPIKVFNILGAENINQNIQIFMYDDGSVKKKTQIK
tara:strand:+ start:1565 stop:2038 length:474 start_codon:yes stop_codon:yes gene_type:complete